MKVQYECIMSALLSWKLLVWCLCVTFSVWSSAPSTWIFQTLPVLTFMLQAVRECSGELVFDHEAWPLFKPEAWPRYKPEAWPRYNPEARILSLFESHDLLMFHSGYCSSWASVAKPGLNKSLHGNGLGGINICMFCF